MGRIPIKRILEIAKQAPSGDNLQPWYFKSDKEDELTLLYKPSPISEPAYYVSGIYCSLGIMVEYVVLASASLGYEAKVNINPNFHHQKDIPVAKFSFTPNESLAASEEIRSLVSAMPKRHTVRTPYEKTDLPKEVMADLERSINIYGANLLFTTNKKARGQIAKFIQFGDKYFWSSDKARRALVESVYDDKKEPSRLYGMPASTLGVGAFALVITKYFALANKFPLLWVPIKTKASLDATSNIYKAGGIGFIQVSKTRPAKLTESEGSLYDHLLGGRAVARLWLTVTKHKLILQPLYHFVAMKVNEDNQSLGPEFTEASQSALPILEEILGKNSDKSLVFTFRIGFPKAGEMNYSPTPRYPIEKLYE